MPEGQAYRTVTADEFATAWPRATLVDVRSREEHATAHVPGSLNIPLDDLPSRLADLPGGTLYLMCGSGKRSSQAARTLTGHGYQTVNVSGGITEWYRAGHPVTYQPAPENPPRQQRGHSPSGLRRLLHRLFQRQSPQAAVGLQDTPGGIYTECRTENLTPFQPKESTRCLSSAFTMKTSPRPVT